MGRGTTGVAVLALALTLGGCGSGAVPAGRQQASAPTSANQAAAAPFDTSLPMREFMEHVMQHAGNGIWKWQGIELDRAGEHSLYPRNTDEWEEAESGALTLAEVTNLLLLPGRRVDEAAWDRSVGDVRRVALQAATAAERQDKDAFLAAGSALDGACDGCHVRYDPVSARRPR